MATNVIPMVPWGASPDDWAHLDVLLGLTSDLLPVVSNPKAVISPESSMKDLGKTPSRYNAQRQVVGFASWTQHSTTPEEIARWAKERDYGICLQTRRVRAIDIDIDDSRLAARVHERVTQLIGELPARTRANASKLLLAFTFDGTLTKRKFKADGGIVELLATGQQFVCCGTHPSGVRYEWLQGLPDDFPTLSGDQVEALWSALVAEFAIEDATTQSASVKTQKLAEVTANDPIAQFLLNTNRVRKAERDGRLHIICPWQDDHSVDNESSTTYWPAHTGGYVNGHFACLHAHCEHRSDQEFLDAIEYLPTDEFESILDSGEGTARQELRAAEPHAARHDLPGQIQGRSEPGVVGAGDAGTAPSTAAVAAGKAPRFAVQPAHAFAQGKPPEWMVKGLLPRAELAVLFGESGSGKSFLALDLAVAIDQGTPWRDRIVRKGRVVYIAAEGAGGFRNRLKAIAGRRGIPLTGLGIGVIPDAPNMMEKADALDVARAIVAAGGADLVIVDTWAQVTPGSNENSGEDMGRALAHCKGIHRATGALVLLVHHSGKDSSKGARGWSGLRAAADVELEVLRNEDARSVTVTKLKEGEDGAEFGFRLENVVLGLDADGEEITSCVVVHGDGRVERTRRGPKGAVEKLVLQQLDELVGLGGEADVAELMAATCNQIPRGEGRRDQRGARVSRAMESLQASGRIVVSGMKVRMV